MYSKYNSDLENINLIYKNPFGAEDYNIYTNLLDIEIIEPEKRIFNEDPKRKKLDPSDGEKKKKKKNKPSEDKE